MTVTKQTRNLGITRRSFSLRAAATLTPVAAAHTATRVPEGITAFSEEWVGGWNARDAHVLAKLHTNDAVTINRYGTLIDGRAESEEALGFLLGPASLFGNVVFSPMAIRKAREISPNVTMAQVNWSAPALGADGKEWQGCGTTRS